MVLPINVRLAIAMLLLIKGTLSQDPTATVAISDNIKKFAEIYGFATQIMNFGGNFIDGGSAGNSNRRSPTAFVDGMPTVPIKMGGYTNYKPISSFESRTLRGPSTEYGGGPLGAESSRSQPKSIIENLMGSFLGSSVDGIGQPSPSNPFAPTSFGEFGSEKSQQRSGSNIEAIVHALTRSGAKRAETEPDNATSFLSQFFGGRKK